MLEISCYFYLMNADHTLNYIREALSHFTEVEEKRMFSGTCFMLNGKMCMCINPEALLCRIGGEQVTIELEKGTCRQMIMNKHTSKDYVYVDLEDISMHRQLDYWINLALLFNPMAKASKKW
jgi:TfoX/Sxy family transcriptional regulator of competence genes